MSLQTYNKLIAYDGREVSYNVETGVVGEIPNLTSKNGIAMEFQINLKCLIGRDKYRIRSVNYTVVGVNESIDTNTDGTDEQIKSALYGVIEAGSRVASDIAYASKGVLVGFFAKLGKYRQDDMPINVASGDNSYATMILDNNYGAEYGANEETGRESILPVNPASLYIRIPWLRDDLSRQDVVNTFDDWTYTDESGFVFSLGQVKFRNEQQTELIALPTQNLRRIKAVETSRPLGRLLANNDTALGIKSDKVASEKMNDFEEGVDDISDDNG